MSLRSLLSLFVCLICFSNCETRSAKASKYNGEIMLHQYEISRGFTQLDSALNTYDGREIDHAHKILAAQIVNGQRMLDTLGTFKGDSMLLLASRDLFNFYEDVSESEYPELMVILQRPDSVYTRADETRAYELDSLIRDRFKTSHEYFISIQSKFWGNYNIVPAEAG